MQELYTYKKGKLWLQSKEGKNIASASLMQLMSQRKDETSHEFLFEANGENASWRLLANAEKMVFVADDGDSIHFVKPVYEHDEFNLAGQASQDNQIIKVSLSPVGCINQNQNYQSYVTKVDWKGKQYIGCGEIHKDNLLHGKWVADEITGWSFPSENKQEQIPYIYFNPFTKSVTGFTGCNRFSGTFHQHDNQLSFGPLLSTKMFCTGSAENFLMQALRDVNSFEMQHDVLTVKKDGNILIVFHAE
jgi:heat shock protein HslJ